jgi:hypothetical protein
MRPGAGLREVDMNRDTGLRVVTTGDVLREDGLPGRVTIMVIYGGWV